MVGRKIGIKTLLMQAFGAHVPAYFFDELHF